MLRTRARPTGEARVLLDPSPSTAGTTVTLTENAVAGALVPGPLQDIGLHPRNVESIARAVRGGLEPVPRSRPDGVTPSVGESRRRPVWTVPKRVPPPTWSLIPGRVPSTPTSS
ncbi:hypothetical protein PSA01_65370 [Pseudonocardia saturnea]|uniref:Uncharacterized protein n=1 Tax=Pseudonocardia saturnea TaxID=33909 RepID=A0ABQ0S9B9_9PSEU|nr:hypothetical protein Pdca_15480 [Pseudonocardia autotrophica]GEC29508.1 hypothetical protein PSA01_65370 [Pseudonocardia saturnea]